VNPTILKNHLAFLIALIVLGAGVINSTAARAQGRRGGGGGSGSGSSSGSSGSS